MAGTTWTKFYWSDWMSDAQLRRCSPAARALWMDMLCIAAQHDPVGFVAVRGEALSADEIARMTGFSAADASDLLAELERNGVYSRDKQGRIYSRRMVRDAQRSAAGRKHGLNGGNPSLGNNKGKSQRVKGGLKSPDITHIPEANNQNPPRSPPDDFEGWLRSQVGEEPVLIDLDVGPIRALLAEGLTRQDIAVGISAAMATGDFRPRAWRQFVGWIRRAAKDRLATAPKSQPSPQGPSDEAWRIVMRDWHEKGDWHPAFGPRGGDDCPAHIKAEFGRKDMH